MMQRRVFETKIIQNLTKNYQNGIYRYYNCKLHKIFKKRRFQRKKRVKNYYLLARSGRNLKNLNLFKDSVINYNR